MRTTAYHMRKIWGFWRFCPYFVVQKKRYCYGKDRSRHTGSHQRARGARGGVRFGRAGHHTQRAEGDTQSAHGAAAGGTRRVRCGVASGARHEGGAGGGHEGGWSQAGDEREEPVYQAEPWMLLPVRDGEHSGGLQPRAGGRGDAGGGGLRRGAAGGVADRGFVFACRDTACRVRRRRIRNADSGHGTPCPYRRVPD